MELMAKKTKSSKHINNLKLNIMTGDKALIVSNVYRKLSVLKTLKYLIEEDGDFILYYQLKNKKGEEIPIMYKDNYFSKEDCNIFLDGINKRVEELEKILEKL